MKSFRGGWDSHSWLSAFSPILRRGTISEIPGSSRNIVPSVVAWSHPLVLFVRRFFIRTITDILPRKNEPTEEYPQGSLQPSGSDGHRFPGDSAWQSRWHLRVGLVDLRRIRRDLQRCRLRGCHPARPRRPRIFRTGWLVQNESGAEPLGQANRHALRHRPRISRQGVALLRLLPPHWKARP